MKLLHIVQYKERKGLDMNNQKLDNLLNLAEDATEEERKKSQNLNVGFDEETKRWELIVKYHGKIPSFGGKEITIVPLLGNYAVVTLPEEELEAFSQNPQVEFIEKPKRLYFELFEARLASCLSSVQNEETGLSGKGILIGVVDSGVDYRHPDFRREDGSSRIQKLWDQSRNGNPPAGYVMGTEYTKEQIDQALGMPEEEGKKLVPEVDYSGHGTSVLGIAAGNGRASGGVQRGIAYESELFVVKLGIPRENSFPRTTELIQGIDYLAREAIERNQPMVINLSFGNNYGSHRGDALLETYIDMVSNMGRLVICTGTGNNGTGNLHTEGNLANRESQRISFGVSPYEPTLNMQLWKSYADQMEIFLEHPSGMRVGPFVEELGPQRFSLGATDLLIYYGKPGPYQISQEIYFDFLPKESYVDSGVWNLILQGKDVKEGTYELWLPGGNVLNPNTGFYFPQAAHTLTIPSTASRIISVGAYDSRNDSYADFSGRGGAFLPMQKPDLVAPGVEILAPVPGGSYGRVTGTSFAAPFVSGAAALLMEWGIGKGNDPFLYGEKVKAYLRRGAKSLPGFTEYPNPMVGYGALCVKDSLPFD